ncbi:hypothetical protein ACOMHN_015507 [Nucella lapillus]
MIRGSSLAVLTVLLCLHAASGNFWDDLLSQWYFNDILSAPDQPTSIDDAIAKASGTATERSLERRSLSGKKTLLAEMDMMITPEQYEQLYGDGGMESRSAGQGVGKSVGIPWTDGVIPYEIETRYFDMNQIDWIKRAMRNWEKHTCVKFVRAMQFDVNKLVFFREKGCWAHLGMTGGTQQSSLSPGCFYKGTVEHELGHAMGLIHEHQRPMRDDHVRIDYFNVQPDNIDQLTKYAEGSDDKYGLSYDYHSVMHYGKTAFSDKTYAQTVYPQWKNKTDVIGLVMGPSFTDFKLINLMYQCNKKCKANTCAADCYQDKDCKCVCDKDVPKEDCKDNPEYRCEQSAKAGMCVFQSGEMIHNCRKTCGLCGVDVPQWKCRDISKECKTYKCNNNPTRARRICAKTCGYCEDLSDKGECKDERADCKARADDGQCHTHAKVMLTECRASCKFCPGDKVTAQCVDYDSICQYYKESGYCVKYAAYMSQKCRSACGNCNNVTKVPDDCKDYSASCFASARKGECARDSQFMQSSCKRSCNVCRVRPQETCYNQNPKCWRWQEEGRCANDFNTRLECPRACGSCVPSVGPNPTLPPTRPPTQPPTTKPLPSGICQDQNRYTCAEYESSCGSSEFIKKFCPRTCGLCIEKCADKLKMCSIVSSKSCSRSPYLQENCGKLCGTCPDPEPVPDNSFCKDILSNAQCTRFKPSCGSSDFTDENCRRTCQLC